MNPAPFTFPLGARVVSRTSGATGVVVGNHRAGWGGEVVTVSWDTAITADTLHHSALRDTGHAPAAPSNVIPLAVCRAARGQPS